MVRVIRKEGTRKNKNAEVKGAVGGLGAAEEELGFIRGKEW